MNNHLCEIQTNAGNEAQIINSPSTFCALSRPAQCDVIVDSDLNAPKVCVNMTHVGKILRLHHDAGWTDIGRIVFASNVSQLYWLIEFPKSRKGRPGVKACKINLPIEVQPDKLDVLLQSNHTLVPFVVPKSWTLTVEELAAGKDIEAKLSKQRRNLLKWRNKFEKACALIKPVFDEYDVRDLLEFGALRAAIKSHALNPRHGQLLRRYVLTELLGCRHPMAQLPAYDNIGGAGTAKFGTQKVGPLPRAFVRGLETEKGYVCSVQDRQRLEYGWTKYKKHKYITVEDAWLLTCAEFWPGECKAKGRDEFLKNRNFLLAPIMQRPSLAQFKWAAKRAGFLATKVNLGERLAARASRVKFDDANSRVRALGELGVIDSTSEDQTPVSEFDRTLVLSSTWRAMYVEAKTDYILGFYSGFERPSTLTNLLAIYNGATSHVEFCAGYGIHITDDQWHYRMCRTIRADNGEMKSETGIAAMSESEVTLEFVRSWDPEAKGQIEAKHKTAHRGTDHRNVGTTGGLLKERGDAPTRKTAARTHRMNVYDLIKWVLWHNNEESVPHLITTEMMGNNPPKPTRKGIYEWLQTYGYVASEPTDLDVLRRHCLPKFKASIRTEGVFIFDPRNGNVIQDLVYSSDWLRGSGLCTKKVRGYEVQLDPNDLSRCYLKRDGKMNELLRRTADPLANELTLREHLEMKEIITDMVYEGEESRQNSKTARRQEADATNKSATAERKKAQKAKAASPTAIASSNTTQSIRANTKAERVAEDLKKIGLHASTENTSGAELDALTDAGTVVNDDDGLTQAALDAYNNWAARVRSQEEAKK